MAQNIQVTNLPPYKFYEMLDSQHSLDTPKSILEMYDNSIYLNNDILKTFCTKLVRNYKDTVVIYDKIRLKELTSYLNLRLDLETHRCQSDNKCVKVKSYVVYSIECAYSFLINESNKPCNRNNHNGKH
ncbi:hypothetical protein POVWA1_082140 [Plasmodium ovale wallikeri]|uniref:PIR Superfamily Protein n=1 Tax=Plasmodium ovale wallikeri TaxID=864142 RepID=A0A1A9AN77_PLAOA|nr:hypothetical protein POVWA1_082140 [Plasmodium ovale wallikeri]